MKVRWAFRALWLEKKMWILNTFKCWNILLSGRSFWDGLPQFFWIHCLYSSTSCVTRIILPSMLWWDSQEKNSFSEGLNDQAVIQLKQSWLDTAYYLSLLSNKWTATSVRSLPLTLIIGIVLGDGWYSVAEHYIGIVKCLLHLHSTIWAPSNIVVCQRQDGYLRLHANTCHVNMWKVCNLLFFIVGISSYLAAVGPQCRAWRVCNRPSCSSGPRLWQRSNLRLLSWCPSSGSWTDDRKAQRIQWEEHRCWCWDCTHPPCSEAGREGSMVERNWQSRNFNIFWPAPDY